MSQVKMTRKVSTKGQVVIPRYFRRLLGIGPGDILSFKKKDGGLTVKKVEIHELP